MLKSTGSTSPLILLRVRRRGSTIINGHRLYTVSTIMNGHGYIISSAKQGTLKPCCKRVKYGWSVYCSGGLVPRGRGKREPGNHCVCMRQIYRKFTVKPSVTRSFDLTDVFCLPCFVGRIGAYAYSGYQALLSPSPREHGDEAIVVYLD